VAFFVFTLLSKPLTGFARRLIFKQTGVKKIDGFGLKRWPLASGFWTVGNVQAEFGLAVVVVKVEGPRWLTSGQWPDWPVEVSASRFVAYWKRPNARLSGRRPVASIFSFVQSKAYPRRRISARHTGMIRPAVFATDGYSPSLLSLPAFRSLPKLPEHVENNVTPGHWPPSVCFMQKIAYKPISSEPMHTPTRLAQRFPARTKLREGVHRLLSLS
jgi:hypothetical protein